MDHSAPGSHGLTPETLDAIAELLQAAAQHDLGVAFEPDGEGWLVSYVMQRDWPAYEDYNLAAGQLSNLDPSRDDEQAHSCRIFSRLTSIRWGG